MNRTISSALALMILLTGCSEVSEQPVTEEKQETPELKKIKPIDVEPDETEDEVTESFGLSEAELKYMEKALGLGTYSHTLDDVAEITRRGEDEHHVNYKVVLKSGETVLPSINKRLLE